MASLRKVYGFGRQVLMVWGLIVAITMLAVLWGLGVALAMGVASPRSSHE